MAPKSWLTVLTLLLVPLAAAGYGTGSQLEVDAPVALDGRADTLLPNGIASFVSDAPTTIVALHLQATDAHVTLRSFSSPCPTPTGPGVPLPCSPQPAQAQDATHELTDVTVTVVKATSAYKILATTDRVHADTSSFGETGSLIVTTAGSSTFGVSDAPASISPMDDAWTSSSESPIEPVYHAEAGSARLASSGAIIRATGGFETFLQGVQATISGTLPDGSEYRETIDTRVPEDAREPVRALIIEASDAELTATSSAPLTSYGPADQRPIVDVHSRASFQRATGTVEYAGDSRGRQEFTQSPVTLDGPLSLTLTKVVKERLTFAIADGLQLDGLANDERNEPIPPGALAAAGAAGAGGAGILIALAYFWPRLKYAGMLALLPMYTRIERDAVLEHEKRDELYELIRVTPGIHAHEIGEKAKIGWGTTVYHLKLLENHGLVVSKKSGRYKRFFVNTGEYTKKKDAYGALRNDTAKAVAEYIVNHPGTTQKEMCAALSIQPSLASWHVEKLEGVELVKRVKDGRMVRYFAGPAWADLNMRLDPMGGGAAPAET